MMRKCHLNTCPVGVATQDPRLRKSLPVSPNMLSTIFSLSPKKCVFCWRHGLSHVDEIIGRANLLAPRPVTHWKAAKVNLRPLLTLPEAPAHYARRHCQKQTHDLEKSIDQRWLKKAQDAILHNKPVEIFG